MKPILFNTDMVRAILDGRKTVTRRVAKGVIEFENGHYNALKRGEWSGAIPETILLKEYAPFRVNDVLYVRETWRKITDTEYGYRADCHKANENVFNWKPSIHMPKEAARLFLRVTDVRVEKLRDMKLEDFLKEGIYIKPSEVVPRGSDQMLTGSERQAAIDCRREAVAREKFKDLWNSTAGKPFSPERYANNWYGNPYVWVIEFEVIPADQAEGN